MISFPNAKINIGLYITEKREDGFHNLETVMYPIPLTDALEFVESEKLIFETGGLPIEGNSNDNIVLKAYQLIKQKYDIPPLHIYLYKNIPTGAGLGGGSSDGAFMLKMLNEYYSLHITKEELVHMAGMLGSDCTFFIENKPCIASGRGEITEPIKLDLSGYCLLLIKPGFGISTKDAYRKIIPQKSDQPIKKQLDSPISQWRDRIKNDFENVLFPGYPELAEIKEKLYQKGAIYAAMSGSGSAMYGIFQSNPDKFIIDFPNHYHTHTSLL